MDYFEPGYEPDGHDSGDGGDDDGGNGGGGPPTPPEPNKKPEGDKNSKLPERTRAVLVLRTVTMGMVTTQ